MLCVCGRQCEMCVCSSEWKLEFPCKIGTPNPNILPIRPVSLLSFSRAHWKRSNSFFLFHPVHIATDFILRRLYSVHGQTAKHTYNSNEHRKENHWQELLFIQKFCAFFIFIFFNISLWRHTEQTRCTLLLCTYFVHSYSGDGKWIVAVVQSVTCQIWHCTQLGRTKSFSHFRNLLPEFGFHAADDIDDRFGYVLWLLSFVWNLPTVVVEWREFIRLCVCVCFIEAIVRRITQCEREVQHPAELRKWGSALTTFRRMLFSSSRFETQQCHRKRAAHQSNNEDGAGGGGARRRRSKKLHANLSNLLFIYVAVWAVLSLPDKHISYSWMEKYWSHVLSILFWCILVYRRINANVLRMWIDSGRQIDKHVKMNWKGMHFALSSVFSPSFRVYT